MQITFSSNKLCHERSSTKVLIFLFLSIFATTYPRYLEFLLDPSPATTYHYYFEKIKHPLVSSINIADDTHGSKIAFRLTVPFIGKILQVGSSGSGKDIVLLYLMQSMLLLPFLHMLIGVLRRATSRNNAYLFTISLSFTYLCKSFFWDYDFWFDGFAYFFMLSGIYFRNSLAIFFCLQLACWTDERAVIALPGIYLFHLIQQNNFNAIIFKQIYNKANIRAGMPIFLVGAVYFLLRVFLGYKYNLTTPSGDQAGVSLSLIPFQLNNRLIGIFLSFEAVWIFPVITFFYYFRAKPFFVSLLFSTLLVQVIVAYSVFDISRSLSYAFPLFITSFVLIAKDAPSLLTKYLPMVAIACFLIPTQYLIYFPRQIPTTITSMDQIFLIAKHLLQRG